MIYSFHFHQVKIWHNGELNNSRCFCLQCFPWCQMLGLLFMDQKVPASLHSGYTLITSHCLRIKPVHNDAHSNASAKLERFLYVYVREIIPVTHTDCFLVLPRCHHLWVSAEERVCVFTTCLNSYSIWSQLQSSHRLRGAFSFSRAFLSPVWPIQHKTNLYQVFGENVRLMLSASWYICIVIYHSLWKSFLFHTLSYCLRPHGIVLLFCQRHLVTSDECSSNNLYIPVLLPQACFAPGGRATNKIRGIWTIRAIIQHNHYRLEQADRVEWANIMIRMGTVIGRQQVPACLPARPVSTQMHSNDIPASVFEIFQHKSSILKTERLHSLPHSLCAPLLTNTSPSGVLCTHFNLVKLLFLSNNKVLWIIFS